MLFRRKKSLSDQVKATEKKMDPEFREAFIGRKTIFSLLSFLLGGVLLGNSLYYSIQQVFPHWVIIVLGLLLFTVGGIISQEFRK